MQAIILAGGEGTRLKSALPDCPKPLADIGGRPLLSWIAHYLRGQGVTDITICLHHGAEMIRGYFTAREPELPVRFLVEPEPLGTGGAIAHALSKTPPRGPVLVMNGDSFADFPVAAMRVFHHEHGGRLTLAVRKSQSSERYSRVQLSGGRVRRYHPRGDALPGWIGMGMYMLDPKLFLGFKLPRVFSFEQDFLAPWAAAFDAGAFVADGYFIDIGVPEDYARAREELPELCRALCAA